MTIRNGKKWLTARLLNGKIWKMNDGEILKNIREILNRRGGSIDDDEAMEVVEDFLLSNVFTSSSNYNLIRERAEQIFYKLRKDMSILHPYMIDDEVSEIMVNGCESVFVEKKGRLVKVNCRFESQVEVEEIIRRIAAKINREFTETSPIVDARLEDGSRVNGVYQNIALNGPILTVRKFPRTVIDMNYLVEVGTITSEAAEFLKKMVKAGYNCFISGGTSSGKTTFLNALSEFIPSNERLIIIEDSAELQIIASENVVRLECKTASYQGRGEVRMGDLIKTSLRMRPDRIIVGEVRDGYALVQMLQGMNTGHSGSLSTGHGNSVRGILKRLESLYLQEHQFPLQAIQSQIAEGIDILIHLGRLSTGERLVFEIAEIANVFEGEMRLNTLFKHSKSKGLIATGNKLVHGEKLAMYTGDLAD